MIARLLRFVAAALGAGVGYEAHGPIGAIAGAALGWLVARVLYGFLGVILATVLWLVVIVGAGLAFLVLAGGG